jgi:hypothetical protein
MKEMQYHVLLTLISYVHCIIYNILVTRYMQLCLSSGLGTPSLPSPYQEMVLVRTFWKPIKNYVYEDKNTIVNHGVFHCVPSLY